MKIALSLNGKFMSAEVDGMVHVNRTAQGAWETWTVEPRGTNQIALKSDHGKYLCAEGGGGGIVIANRDEVGAWETFSINGPLTNNVGITLLCVDGQHYVSAGLDTNHTLRAVNAIPVVFNNTVIEADPIPDPKPHEGGFLNAPVGKMDLYDDKGNPWLFAGIATHLLLNLVIQGVDIRPLLQEWIDVGANTTIVIGQHMSPWKIDNGYKLDPDEHPDYQHKLAEMFDIHAEMGMRCMFHVWADLQFQKPGFDDHGHFNRCRDTMRGRWNVFASKGNEYTVNGWDPARYDFGDMGGVLKTQGSGGEEVNPYVPYLDITMFEVTRGRKRLYDNGAGMRQLFDGDFQGPATNRATLSIEPTAFNDVSPDHVGDTRETDWKVALAMAVNISANCAGGGLTMSKPMEAKRMTEGDKKIAREWFRGLRAGFVR